MKFLYSGDKPIGIILNPGEQCNCEQVKEIPVNDRTWCNECISKNNIKNNNNK